MLNYPIRKILKSDLPEDINRLQKPPEWLYARGNVGLLKSLPSKAIAIVGTRKPSSYGISVTTQFATRLTQSGLIIISGLAFGIDITAHLAALEARGQTIAVLAHGLDMVYPTSHEQYVNKILRNDGLLLSPYPTGIQPLKYRFLERNVLIAALSRTVLVVEGTAKSGSINTAAHSGQQGKDVLVLPGNLTSPLMAGPLELYRSGAKMMAQPEHIIEDYYPEMRQLPKMEVLLSNNPIVRHLMIQPATVEDIILACGKSPESVLVDLTELELENVITKTMFGEYRLT